jgi:hypothetical protein
MAVQVSRVQVTVVKMTVEYPNRVRTVLEVQFNLVVPDQMVDHHSQSRQLAAAAESVLYRYGVCYPIHGSPEYLRHRNVVAILT